jgi:hypothetical protein
VFVIFADIDRRTATSRRSADAQAERQTTAVIDPRFVFLGAAISLAGSYVYIRNTWRGVTAPNRVSWSLWALEPLLAFAVERQEHVGLASVMALVLGVVPVIVISVSFHDPKSVWRIGRFDIMCGMISVAGLVVWAVSDQTTVALVAFVAADAVAALPTVRKAFREPASESPWTFLGSALFAAITLLTLRSFTTAGGLFPTSVLALSLIIWSLVATRVGIRTTWRSRPAVAP